MLQKVTKDIKFTKEYKYHMTMKARIFSFIMLLAVSLTISAQKKVAVYMTGDETGVRKVLADQLVAAFARSGKYIAVERTASFLAELGKEQNYQRSGAVSDKEIAALGVQFGVNYVCVADISEAFGEKYISARLIDVETVEIVNTHNVSGEMNSMSKCLQMANEITQNLTKGTFTEQATEASQKEEQEKVQLKALGYIDLGLPSGTLWKGSNEIGYYTYEEAERDFRNQLPTEMQFRELKEKCQWLWSDTGYRVIGPNGNYIVFPVSGMRFQDGYIDLMRGGRYWSLTQSEDNPNYSWFLGFYPSDKVEINTTFHEYGLSVRLIYKPSAIKDK